MVADVFEVYLMQSPKLKSSGECLLRVTSDSIELLDIQNPSRVQLSWPLNGIRRYSVERGMFSLEAGRSIAVFVYWICDQYCKLAEIIANKDEYLNKGIIFIALISGF